MTANRPHPDRFNARGDVYCHECKHHLHPDCFRPWPGKDPQPGRLWPYCKECTRKLDRLRYHAKVSTPEGRKREMAARNRRDRRQKRAEYAERRETASNAIKVLNQRGLTQMDIAVILAVSPVTVNNWAHRKVRKPTSAAVERLLALVTATRDWPLLDQPAYRRRLPHPRREELRERLQPTVLRFRLRDSWISGKRAA